MITIENIGEHNAAHIVANGYTASVMYDPNTNPLRPFQTVEALRLFAESIEVDFNNKPTAPEEVIVPEIMSYLGREWRPDLFWRRFTTEEQVTLVAAAKENPVVETFRMHLMMTPVVQADDDVTINGMSYLVSTGLISEARKNEILGGE